MKDVQNLDLKKVYLHFTQGKNLDSILQNGLLPKIGANAKHLEESSKVFFSVGFDSLILYDNWIRWFIYRKQEAKYRSHCEQKYGLENDYYSYRQQADMKLYEDFVSGALYTEENLNEAFEEFYKLTKTNIFLVLDLKEGEDFDSEDVDEIKQRNLSSGDKKREERIKSMYGRGLTKKAKNPYQMEKWNMHTKPNHTISQDKIEQLCIDGKTDMLSILFYLYEKSNDKNFDFLNEFITFAKRKNQLLEA